MTTEPDPVNEAAPSPAPAPAAPVPADAAAPVETPRVTPEPESGERLPQMIERTRRRGRRRRAPVFTPQEVKTIDYKDVDRLKKLISDRGRIEPRRKTGLTSKDQRKVSREIKRARQVALLPYTAEHMRQTSRFRMVTRMAQRAMRAELDDAPPSEPVEGGAELEAPAAATAPVDAAPVASGAVETAQAEAPVSEAPSTAQDAAQDQAGAESIAPAAETAPDETAPVATDAEATELVEAAASEAPSAVQDAGQDEAGAESDAPAAAAVSVETVSEEATTAEVAAAEAPSDEQDAESDG